MPIDYSALKTVPRLLLEARLQPLQGARFQPTGFPDLGAARYSLADGTEMLLVESAQSVANRMELACWDEAAQDLVEPLRGLPYIRVLGGDGKPLTNSLLEAHRINSEYIMKSGGKDTDFSQQFSMEIEWRKDGQVNWKQFHIALLKYDPNSLIHGAFLEEIGGRLRVTRALSGFIEARNIRAAEYGGVKNNIVQPELKGGAGNVPYHRTEFVAEEISAFFNLDLALLWGYGLADEATQLLISLALFKVRRFLSAGLRLRTACDLKMDSDGGLAVTQPAGFAVPPEGELLVACKRLIEACQDKNLFAGLTTVKWEADKGIARKKEAETPDEQETEE